MKILGIDPGSRKAGWALIEKDGRKITYLSSGSLRYDKIDNFVDRLGVIYNSIQELMTEYSPAVVAIESLIYVKSVTSLAKLAQARGAMIAAIVQTHSGKVYEYSPNSIKSTVTGYGHADKLAIEKTLKMIFGQIEFKTNDESDALAIALCHALGGSTNVAGTKVKSSSRGRTLKSVFKDREKRS
ncbi:crossover junction endodeoxyribonuclease RuvC [Halobacteriovorax marinus]|uniref:Crossover junction endodeoxyribonuclease RuvC n=1 Tax=Halobacteriovorax marinus TaxID=97084 RepID=A0A1Y5F124_9BACT|nr:crossover junction endodeoxyribonuclease RuvC [Halobacteriovorax marinus]